MVSVVRGDSWAGRLILTSSPAKDAEAKLAEVRLALKDAVGSLSKHEPLEEGAVSSTTVTREREDSEELLGVTTQGCKQHYKEDKSSSKDVSMYPNLNHLNLLGEDQSQLLPRPTPPASHDICLSGMRL